MNRSIRKSAACILSSVAITIIGSFSSAANAAIINGNFETDLSPWQSIGATGTKATATQGHYSAYIEGTDCFVGSMPCVPATAVESFMGVDDTQLYKINRPLLDSTLSQTGSAIKQTFVTNKASTLSFDFRTLTDEPSMWMFGDFTFFVLDGNAFALGRTVDRSGFGAGVEGYAFATDWASYELYIGAGAHTLSFGAMQAGDTHIATALLIDNVKVIGNVPEPSSIALCLIGVCGLALTRRRTV